MGQKLRLGEILLASGVLSPDKLEEALKAQMIYGGRLGTSLVELGLIDEHELARVLSEQLHLPVADREQLENIPQRVLGILTSQQAQRLQAIPFRIEERHAYIAMVDPSPVAVDEVQFTTGMTVRPHVVPEVYLNYCLERHYGIPRPSRYIRLVDEDPLFRGHPSAPGSERGGRPPRPEPAPPGPSGEGGQPAASGPAAATIPWSAESSIADCVKRLLVASSEKEIIDAAVEFAAGYFEKVAIFVGKEEQFRLVRSEGVASDLPKALQIPLGHAMFRAVLADGKAHAGPAPAELQSLATAMGEGPRALLFVAPLFVTKWEGILVGAGFRQALGEKEARQFAILCEKITLALDVLMLRRRLETLPEDLG